LVTSNDSSLSFFYEVYSDFEQAVKIQYTINDVNSKPLYVHTSDEKVKKGKTEINKILNGISFGLGDYQLEVRIVDEENNIIKGSGKKFSAQISGVPTSIKDLDLAIQQMQYIASPSELDEIEEIKDYDEKLDNYLEYWNKKDPSPNSVENETMNEYYRRVEYANEHFKGYFKGWKSDMGMIYITLGPPDQVTRRPYEMDTRPYEIWDYFVINRSFVFIDQTNFGDYRLQNPVFGEWFRYRP
jgi:GWxTD domain-containing protein